MKKLLLVLLFLLSSCTAKQNNAVGKMDIYTCKSQGDHLIKVSSIFGDLLPSVENYFYQFTDLDDYKSASLMLIEPFTGNTSGYQYDSSQFVFTQTDNLSMKDIIKEFPITQSTIIDKGIKENAFTEMSFNYSNSIDGCSNQFTLINSNKDNKINFDELVNEMNNLKQYQLVEDASDYKSFSFGDTNEIISIKNKENTIEIIYRYGFADTAKK